MQGRSVRRAVTDPRSVAEPAEGRPDALVDDAGAAQRDKQGVCLGVRVELAAALLIALQRLQGAGLQRHVARLAELRTADEQGSASPSSMSSAIWTQRLADAQAGGRQQPDQRLVGRGAQRLADRAARRGHQRQRVVVCVDERRAPRARDPDQAGRRHLGARVDPGEIAREPADGCHPMAGDGAASGPVAVQRPRERRGRRHVVAVAGVEILHEPRQLASGIVELVAEQAPQPQIVIEVAGQRAHGVAQATAARLDAGDRDRPWRRRPSWPGRCDAKAG